MNKFQLFLTKYFNVIALVLLIMIFFRTCSSSEHTINKRIDKLTEKVDSMSKITVTRKDLTIEGLKSEKRMIQSTDRKMMDVNRQTEIDKEIETLNK